jgi:hypothetical protein
MLGAEAEVIDRSGSAHLEPGDILFAKLVPVEGIHLVEGMGPVAVPPVHKPALVDLRKRIGTRDSLFGSDVLREFDMELREVYFRIADSLLNPRLPELRNTDGDPLEMHTLISDLEAPEAAFEALKDLGAGLSAEEVESGAQRNADGGLVRGEITWRRLGNRMHKDWDNTSLGTLRIEGRRLIAEVNSAKRAAALRKLIEPTNGLVGDLVGAASALIGGASGAAQQADRPLVPVTLFVFGPGTILPVRVKEVSVEITDFLPTLFPMRAKVTLSLQVLTPDVFKCKSTTATSVAIAAYNLTKLQDDALAIASAVSGAAGILSLLPI